MTSGTILVGVVDTSVRARVVGTIERAGFDVAEVHEAGACSIWRGAFRPT